MTIDWYVWRRRLVLAVALLGLAACSTTQLTVASDPTKTPPQAGESVVVISITVNTAQVTAFDSLSLRRVQPAEMRGDTLVEMKQVSRGLARDTSLFIGVLAPGDYEFTQFNNQATRQLLRVNDGTRQALGFRVHSGRAVDLGRLVVTPINTRVLVGRSALVTSNRALMQRFAPEHAALFGGDVAEGWLQPRGADDRIEEYALARPVGAQQPHEASDGRVVAASRLGTVLLRGTDGRWRALRSGGLEALMYATTTELPEASVLAVGEFGTMLRLPAGAQRLEPVNPGNLPPGNLLFIEGNAAAGWVVAHQRGDDVTLFHSRQLEAGQWQALRTERVGRDFWSGANSFWAWKTATGIGYAVSQGPIHFLDFASGQWVARKTPKDNRLLAIAHNPDGSIGVLTSPGGGFGGVFAGLYLSKDQALTWQEVSTEFKVKVVPPMRLADGTLLLSGGVFSKPELHASKDDGRTWARVGDFQLDRTLVPLKSGALLAVDRGQFGLFGIRHSSDGGVTWRTEYSNFDRLAYEAEEKRKKP